MEEIICKRCGVHASVDEDFCGGCGAFLEWEGERVVVDDGPAPISSPLSFRPDVGTPSSTSVGTGGSPARATYRTAETPAAAPPSAPRRAG